MVRMNRKEEFKKVVNFYLIIKYFDKDSKEYKSAFEVLKFGSPYTCMICKNKSGLSFIEPEHDCRKPMFNKKHIPHEDYLIKKCDEYEWDWKKIINHFEELARKNKIEVQKRKNGKKRKN